MIHPSTLTDTFFNESEISETKQVNIGDLIETNFGVDHIVLTPEDIKHMVAGGKIWVSINDGEYAGVIELKGAHHV